MYGVQVVVQWLDVVVMDGHDGVVGLSEPEEYDVTGCDGAVTSGIIG